VIFYEEVLKPKVIYVDRLICKGTNGRNYFIRDGHLCNAVRGKDKVRESSLRKLGLVEESFLEERLK